MKLYDYAAAAEELGIKESWLRDHIGDLPNSKIGREVKFTDADLERIVQIFHREPTTGPLAKATSAVAAETAGTHPMSELRPINTRRKRAA
jgi:hypothetical protein